jgi:transposase InsO family protein
MDNGTQFDAEAFKEFCEQIGTKIHFASVRHPESNGLAERANGIIITTPKSYTSYGFLTYYSFYNKP